MFMFSTLVFIGLASLINGHGYMQDPPARNSMWRFGFPQNGKNYNDNENFCGGAVYQQNNGGKCGVCGDPYGKPQRHANGGPYDNGIIVRTYKPGQTVDVEVLLTTSHVGHFEFRIGTKAVGDSLGKLQGTLLELASGGTKYIIQNYGRQLVKLQLKLPSGYKCDKCVMQWWYRGGNNWGCDQTGCGKGHGAQEHFVNCADISIKDV